MIRIVSLLGSSVAEQIIPVHACKSLESLSSMDTSSWGMGNPPQAFLSHPSHKNFWATLSSSRYLERDVSLNVMEHDLCGAAAEGTQLTMRLSYIFRPLGAD